MRDEKVQAHTRPLAGSAQNALIALAVRCEREEPSRELDRAIWLAIDPGAKPTAADWDDYTISLDAAVTLVPEGWVFEISQAFDIKPSFTAQIRAKPNGAIFYNFGRYKNDDGTSAMDIDAYLKALKWTRSAALALCAAALRARATLGSAQSDRSTRV